MGGVANNDITGFRFIVLLLSLLFSQERVVVKIEQNCINHLADGSIEQLDVWNFTVALIFQYHGQANFPL